MTGPGTPVAGFLPHGGALEGLAEVQRMSRNMWSRMLIVGLVVGGLWATPARAHSLKKMELSASRTGFFEDKRLNSARVHKSGRLELLSQKRTVIRYQHPVHLVGSDLTVGVRGPGGKRYLAMEFLF